MGEIFSKKFSKTGKIGHNKWALVFGKCSVWVKNQNSKKPVNSDSRNTLELLSAKKRLRKTPDIRKMKSSRKSPKIGHNARAIAFAKCSV